MARLFLPRVRRALRTVGTSESGATMVEYALMLSLVALVCIVAVTAVGTSTRDAYNVTATAMSGESGGDGPADGGDGGGSGDNNGGGTGFGGGNGGGNGQGAENGNGIP